MEDLVVKRRHDILWEKRYLCENGSQILQFPSSKLPKFNKTKIIEAMELQHIKLEGSQNKNKHQTFGGK